VTTTDDIETTVSSRLLDDSSEMIPVDETSEVAAAAAAAAAIAWEERVLVVRRHFEQKGYRVHSGLQFGCELVLYADDPSRVHSDFGVHVVPADGHLDWRQMQSLVRSMPGLHKTLILANVRRSGKEYEVDELAMATEHAPFRHKKTVVQVGEQRKKARTTQEPASEPKTEENMDSTRQVSSSDMRPTEVEEEEQQATNAP
jgi:tRNA-intron lyase